jgi:hypothetical protein
MESDGGSIDEHEPVAEVHSSGLWRQRGRDGAVDLPGDDASAELATQGTGAGRSVA